MPAKCNWQQQERRKQIHRRPPTDQRCPPVWVVVQSPVSSPLCFLLLPTAPLCGTRFSFMCALCYLTVDQHIVPSIGYVHWVRSLISYIFMYIVHLFAHILIWKNDREQWGYNATGNRKNCRVNYCTTNGKKSNESKWMKYATVKRVGLSVGRLHNITPGSWSRRLPEQMAGNGKSFTASRLLGLWPAAGAPVSLSERPTLAHWLDYQTTSSTALKKCGWCRLRPVAAQVNHS